jgi:hypothetical protein
MHLPSSGLRMPADVLLLVVLLLWSAGCAKIADPQPPEILIPKPATDLAAHQVSDFIMLSVSAPTQNTNGSPVSTLQKVIVYRFINKRTAVREPLSDAEFLKQASQIVSIPSENFSGYLHNSSFLIQDRPSPGSGSSIYSDEFQYAALFVNNKNQAAGLSNRVRIEPIPIPSPPSGLSCTVTEHSIHLKWEAPLQNLDGSEPARIAGYDLYRSEARDRFPAEPINSKPLEKAEFEDRDIEFDKTYYYAVRILGSLQNPFAESLPSETIEVTVHDTFPPSPPRDFNALPEGKTIMLLWAPSLSTDVAGYRIYRREKGSPNLQLLQDKLVSAWSFRDSGVASGKSYEYSVHAVDFHGNESTAVTASVDIP